MGPRNNEVLSAARSIDYLAGGLHVKLRATMEYHVTYRLTYSHITYRNGDTDPVSICYSVLLKPVRGFSTFNVNTVNSRSYDIYWYIIELSMIAAEADVKHCINIMIWAGKKNTALIRNVWKYCIFYLQKNKTQLGYLKHPVCLFVVVIFNSSIHTLWTLMYVYFTYVFRNKLVDSSHHVSQEIPYHGPYCQQSSTQFNTSGRGNTHYHQRTKRLRFRGTHSENRGFG